jgi:orotate phosphoribosyltransferase
MHTDASDVRKQRLLGLLKTHSFEQKPVTLTSGKKSNFYIDCRKVALSAEGHFLIGLLFNHLLATHHPEVQAVGGMTLGADPLVSATATLSFLSPHPLEAFYVRKQAKQHGTSSWVEASALLASGAPTAVLEDVVTTGGSTLRAIERARAHGLDVRCVLALVDRQEGGAKAIATQTPFRALFNRGDFLPVGAES